MSESEIEGAFGDLSAIRAEMVARPSRSLARLEEVHPNYRDSARNLLQYLALRRRDMRPLQLKLAAMGLSSLGRAESHVLASVDAVLCALACMLHREWQAPAQEDAVLNFEGGARLLAEHADALLGPAPADRSVRIMVTMPSEAADDGRIAHDLLERGMDCMRINCAHDDASAWDRMIEHMRKAERSLGRSCRVVMDLAGPKLRTGPMEAGPAVVKVHPSRDECGRVATPARIWLTAEGSSAASPATARACLPVPANWLASLREGDRVSFIDARNAKRSFTVVEAKPHGCWAEAVKTAYITPGTVLRRGRGSAGKARTAVKTGREGHVGELPHVDGFILLQRGDSLILTRDLAPGRAAVVDGEGKAIVVATIGCTIPEVFDDVKAGEAIWFDDGKIGGIVERVGPSRVLVRISQELPKPMKLRADKGINLPDSDLRLEAMTAKDIEDLAFVARHADVVELSFANSVGDVESLQSRMAGLGTRPAAIVLKIETRRGFEALPDMLLTAMRAPCVGVMIARGDLAVECGFERMAEVQEEILWICEAAHVPVIWATQVLETLAQTGMPSRAEISDAAMGDRAECVMLNKGPYAVSAVQALDDILRRMQAHQTKKGSMLRALRLARELPEEIAVEAKLDEDSSRPL
jgi:pyruvate kinase